MNLKYKVGELVYIKRALNRKYNPKVYKIVDVRDQGEEDWDGYPEHPAYYILTRDDITHYISYTEDEVISVSDYHFNKDLEDILK